MRKIIVFFSLALFALCFNATAATYYVSTGGNDTNSGTSPNDPWYHCPGMVGWTGSTTLSPGDIIYFDSGDKWVWHNSDGARFLSITGGVQYIGNAWPVSDSDCSDGGCAEFELSSDHDYHGSNQRWRVIFWGQDDATYETVFNGFEIDFNNESTAGIGMNYQGAEGATLTGETKRIENCYIHDQYHPGDDYQYAIYIGTGPNSNTGWPNQGEPDGFNTENVEILNNVIHNVSRDPICLYPANDSDHADNWVRFVTIRGNDVQWVNCTAEPCSSNRINPYAAGSGIMMKNRVRDVIIEYNHVNHTFGSSFASNRDSSTHIYGPYDVDIRYNIGANANSAGMKLKSGGIADANVYGNIFINAPILLTDHLDDVKTYNIYNNTVYMTSGNAIQFTSAIADFSQVTVNLTNNIFFTRSGAAYYNYEGSEPNSFTHSNNIFYTGSGDSQAVVATAHGTYTMSNITNWEPTALGEDPSFKNIFNLPTGFTGTHGVDLAPNPDGLSISAGSVPVDNGIDLGLTYGNSINSVSRSGSWDIGAYELLSNPLLPSPPSGVWLVE